MTSTTRQSGLERRGCAPHQQTPHGGSRPRPSPSRQRGLAPATGSASATVPQARNQTNHPVSLRATEEPLRAGIWVHPPRSTLACVLATAPRTEPPALQKHTRRRRNSPRTRTYVSPYSAQNRTQSCLPALTCTGPSKPSAWTPFGNQHPKRPLRPEGRPGGGRVSGGISCRRRRRSRAALRGAPSAGET